MHSIYKNNIEFLILLSNLSKIYIAVHLVEYGILIFFFSYGHIECESRINGHLLCRLYRKKRVTPTYPNFKIARFRKQCRYPI